MATTDPTWFDACSVKKILQDTEKDKSIEVSGITIKPATSKGDNYASDMFRVAVEFSRVRDGHVLQEKRTLILKAVPENENRAEMVEAGGFFVTELSMLSVTLVRMNEILQNMCSASLAPRCLHVQYEKPCHAVIEDLAPKGYRMADRHAGMDLDHCVLAIRNIGRLHAASIALKEKDPKAFTQYNKPMFHKDQPPPVQQFLTTSAKTLADEITKWPEFDQRIPEKLYKLRTVLFERISEASQYLEDDFNVLNHGDCWVNNMMFRYDEQQKPVDQIFVDFQLSYYGSPAVDILYFLGTSPNNEVRLEHRELLLHEYYESLTSTMTELKCKTETISFESLKETLKKRAYGEFSAALIILPIVALEKNEELDLGSIKDQGEEFKNPGYRSKSYQKIMSKLLLQFDSMGLFDV